MTNYIGIDIGGTEIKYGLLTSTGTILKKGSITTGLFSKADVPHFMGKLQDIIDKYKFYQVGGVGIATAGIVNPMTGVVITGGPNKPGFNGLRLKEFVTGYYNNQFACAVENDVNAAGLGEYWLGAGQGIKSLFCMTIGTGIGGCLILDGKLVHGATNSAGEIGNTFIGVPGIFEDLASTTALVKEVTLAKKLSLADTNGKIVMDLAESGDKTTVQAVQKFVDNIAHGIANVCSIVNPELIILGGGIMTRKEYFYPLLNTVLQKILLPTVYAGTRIEFAQLGNDAGMIG